MSYSNAEFTQRSRTVFPLTSLSIGFWSSRKSRKVLLLSLPDKNKFVLLCVEDYRQKTAGRLDKALSQVNSIWDSRNPFNACSPSNTNDSSVDSIRWVVAFEVEWCHIVGLDYRFCLLQEGRLVLETSCIVKRVFKTIEDVHAFYEWTPPEQEDSFDDYQTARNHVRRNTYSGGYDGLFFHPSASLSGQWEDWLAHRTGEEARSNTFGSRESDLDGVRSNSSSHYDMLRVYAAGLTPRGSSQHTLGNLPCTPPRVVASTRSWPSSQLCEALHLMGASHKDTSSCYRTPSIPGPARFTLPSATYSYQTVILGFCDPNLLTHLAAWVKADVSRVKLYESGLPSWAVFLPSYGLWYHPWMRTAAWVLYMAISIFSMACGFYDLYKNVPYLKQVVSSIMARLHLPRYALLEWLEHHAQIRLSILLTYMFSKSPLFSSFLRLLSSFLAVVTNLLQPMLNLLSPVWESMFLAVRTFTTGCSTLAVAAQEVVVILFGPPVQTMITCLCAVFQATSEVLLVVGSCMGSALLAPLQLLMLPFWTLLAMCGALLQGMQASAEQVMLAWRAFRSTWGTVKAGSKVVKGGLAAATPVAKSVPVLSLLQVPGEALDMLRMSFVKVVKALQAVIRFLISLVLKVVQHRFSLTLQAYRYWTSTQTSVLTRLRSYTWLRRLLPEPAPPPPDLDPHNPLATTSLSHSSFGYLHPPLSSLSRSSSSSSIHDSSELDSLQEHTSLLHIKSHGVSLRSRVESVTDSGMELCVPNREGVSSGGPAYGRLASWHGGESSACQVDGRHISPPARLTPAWNNASLGFRDVQSFSTAGSRQQHHARHRRTRSEQMWEAQFDACHAKRAAACSLVAAGGLERSCTETCGTWVGMNSSEVEPKVSTTGTLEKEQGGQVDGRERGGECGGLGKRTARQLFVVGAPGTRRCSNGPDGASREKVGRTCKMQTSPVGHPSTAVGQSLSVSRPINVHAASTAPADASCHIRDLPAEKAITWGVTNLPWASYPSLQVRERDCTSQQVSKAGRKHGGQPPGQRLHGVETAPVRPSAEPPWPPPDPPHRTWVSCSFPPRHNGLDSADPLGSVSVTCSCGARMCLPSGMNPTCCMYDVCGDMCALSAESLKPSTPGVHQFHQGATAVTLQPQIRRRQKKKGAQHVDSTVHPSVQT